jgi:hypothetical protein
MIEAFLPDVAPGAMLRLRRGDKVLWTRQAPAIPVKVRIMQAEINERGQLSLRWEIQAANDSNLETWIRWSADKEETWHALTVGLKGEDATLNLNNIPEGEVHFQVMVHDGFNTAIDVTKALSVPHKPPVAAILHPKDGTQVKRGRLIRLWGLATNEVGEPLPSEASQWFLDGRPLERGPDIFIPAPAPGQHKLTLKVEDQKGYQTEIHGTFKVIGDQRIK